MSELVGVHGIAQQQRGSHQLQAPWRQSLADGLERAVGHPVAEPPLNIAYYGDIFLSTPRANGLKEILDCPASLDDLDEDELIDLTAAVGDLLSPRELAAAQTEGSKGYTRSPMPLQVALSAIDRKFGASAGILYLGELRQVRRYLSCPAVKAEVDARLSSAITSDCRVLIGHSLGSVVAFEYLRQHADHPIGLLLTLGSPLGLRLVRSRMPDPVDGTRLPTPANIPTWVNLRDPHDPVACAGNLRQWWPLIHDLEVNNDSDSHSAERYLGKKQAGDAVLSIMPELAQ